MDDMEIASICKALGDENRVKIIKMLTKGELCACKIHDALEVTQPTLSHHMKILAQAGLVTVRKDRKWAYYAVNCQRFSAFKAVVAEICCADGAKSADGSCSCNSESEGK